MSQENPDLTFLHIAVSYFWLLEHDVLYFKFMLPGYCKDACIQNSQCKAIVCTATKDAVFGQIITSDAPEFQFDANVWTFCKTRSKFALKVVSICILP